jgi:hypothetical protein
MIKYIGYLGGTRIDYQGYSSKGGVLSEDINQAIDSMRKAKKRGNIGLNARWRDNDYIEIQENNTSRKLLMKDAWNQRL